MRMLSKVTAGCATLIVACGGGDRENGAADTGAVGTTAVSGGDAAAAAGAPALVALGDSVFHGQVAAGLCVTCHGPDAKGTPLGPDLTDAQWLNGDGSEASITSIVTNGVPAPKQYPNPMPPKGGGTLTDEQVRAVAAYVRSLGAR